MQRLATKTCSNCSIVFQGEQDILKHTAHWRVCENDYFWFTCRCGSTLVLKADEVEWFNPGGDDQGLLSMLADRHQFPRLPRALFYLQEALSDENADAKDVAAASRKDPITAAGVLLIANRLRHSRDRRIDTLEHAVSYIGRDMVKLIALTSALGSLKFMTASYRAVAFWNEAFLTGAVCEALAHSLAPQVSPDEAYIAGTLCNVGKVVNAIYVPQVIDRIAGMCDNPDQQVSWEMAERQITALAHTKSGEFAASEWGLPTFVVDAIREHHSLPKFGIDRTRGLTLVELVSFANQLAHIAARRIGRIDKDIFNSYTAILHFNKGDIKSTLKDLQPAVREAAETARSMSQLGA